MKKILFFISIIFIVFSCSKSESSQGLNDRGDGISGVGGSMARFTIVGNTLYTVDNNSLNVFDITKGTKPNYLSKFQLGMGIETIWPYKGKLFIGTNSGMQIYDISTPTNPQRLSVYSHILACDPVVADDKYAYVTLHTDSRCGRNTNELQIVNISNLTKPKFEKSYQMTKPLGLGISDSLLFVCDAGLKVFDSKDPLNLKLKHHFDIKDAYDVIAYKKLLIVSSAQSIYQYKYENDTVVAISQIK